MFNSKDDILWNAVSSGNIEEVVRAVKSGGNVNMTCTDSWVRGEVAAKSAGTGKSLLHHAAWIGSLPIFKYLVECGADFERRRYTAWRPNGGVNGRGPTPLHHAVQYNRTDIVKYLISIGCDINTPGEQGYTALHLAAKFNYPHLVKLLLEAGARSDMITRDEKTARDLAAGQQDRSHAQMGDMLRLFDQYDAEYKNRPKPLPGAPLPEWNRSIVCVDGVPDKLLTNQSTPSRSEWKSTNTLKDTLANAIETKEILFGERECNEVHDAYRKKNIRAGYHNASVSSTENSGGGISADAYRDRSCNNGEPTPEKYSHLHSALQTTPTSLSARRKVADRMSERSAFHNRGISGGTQNTGNVIGTRSTVRQSKLFRMYESGNDVKSLLGQESLVWDTTKKQGAYSGPVFDAHAYVGIKAQRIKGGIHSQPRSHLVKKEDEYSMWSTTSRSSYRQPY
mmetsp:Transcript_9552/g.14377  ORF Transcript_9552/g.14377 Transcript_9552/m.14377 type:complete len:452 (-) Transcript_9552:98-1453(-)